MGDPKTVFLHIPWAAALLNRPNIIVTTPGCINFKASTEDSLLAETLRSPRGMDSWLCFFERPSAEQDSIEEVSTLITMGDGMNGHPQILHGGMVATILDEGMGILQGRSRERAHLRRVGKGWADGEIPPIAGTFTAELKIRYLKPVRTPGALLVTARFVKREGRKEWINCELKQYVTEEGGVADREVVCATAEALFIDPKPNRSNL